MKIEELQAEHESIFLAMIREYDEVDRDFLGYLCSKGKPPANSAAFKKFLKECEKLRMDWRPKAKQVSITNYVLRDPDSGGELAAHGIMRFPLTQQSETE